MPNWCEGTLKVRGDIENVKRFVDEALNPVTFLGDEAPEGKVLKTHDESSFWYEFNKTLHIKGTRRNFIESTDAEVYSDDGEPVILMLDFKAAWGIESEPLAALSKEYEIDFKITGFEMGMEFCQEIEIHNGDVIRDEEVKYENYRWECPCPMMGG